MPPGVPTSLLLVLGRCSVNPFEFTEEHIGVPDPDDRDQLGRIAPREARHAVGQLSRLEPSRILLVIDAIPLPSMLLVTSLTR